MASVGPPPNARAQKKPTLKGGSMKLGLASGIVLGSMFSLSVVAAGYGIWQRSRGIDPMDHSHLPRNFVSQRVDAVVNKDAHMAKSRMQADDRMQRARERREAEEIVGAQYVERAR
eukprot:TRINITY_DN2366_c0_g1_i1.p1 TRINITY_DN2366_c0_g1~~TRINITY_DN2366_c0_g1_i1.p1  ORF type:complete len:116 (-),score=21.30 TRINITY_DN2366_c0_g1_i1:25-372(-)